MIKIEKHLDWVSSPQIWIEDETFTIYLKDDMVEIECDWDHGWGGRGTERMEISFDELKKLMEELQNSKNQQTSK